MNIFTMNRRKHRDDSREPRGLDPRIQMALYSFFRRSQLMLVLRGICLIVVIFLVAFGTLATVDYFWLIDDRYRVLGSGLAYLLILLAVAKWIAGPWLQREEPETTAVKFEQAEPNLRNHLLAAVELGDGLWDGDSPAAGSAQLRQVLQSRVARYIATVPVASLLSFRVLRPWVSTVALLLALLIVTMLIPGSPVALLYARALAPTANLARASLTKITILQPNDQTPFVPANETILVEGLIKGDRVTSARLQYREHESDAIDETSMLLAGDDSTSRYVANLDVGEQPTQFRILAGDAITAWREINPRPRPVIESAELTITPPAYALSDTLTEPFEDHEILVLSGSEVDVLATINQPFSTAEIAIIDQVPSATNLQEDNQPLIRDSLTSVKHSFGSVVARKTFQMHFVASETGFENKFPPKYVIETVDDAPPIVKLSLAGQSSMLAPPRDLVPLTLEVRDELPIEIVRLEFAVNEADWRAYPLQPDLKLLSDAGELRRFRAIYRVSTDLDLAEISLKEGDLLRLRLTVTDRRSQKTVSNEGRVLITSDYFTDKRYNYIDQRMRWLALISQWVSSKSDEVNLQHLLDEGVKLLAISPAGPESMEVEWLTRAAFSVEESKPPSTDHLRHEKKRIQAAAEWFVAYSLGEVVAKDVQALEAFARRSRERSGQASPKWKQRQLELLQASYESCLSKYENLNDALPISSRRAIRGLIDQWQSRCNRIDAVLGEAFNPRRIEAEQKFQWEQLQSERNNPVLDSSVCGGAVDAIRQLHQIMSTRGRTSATMIANISQHFAAQQSLKDRREKITDPAEAGPLKQKIEQANQAILTMVRHLDEKLRASHAIHAARVDVSPARLEDLDLIQQAVSAVLRRQVEGIESAAAFREISMATGVLDAGTEVAEMESLLRILALDERWARNAIVARLLNPKRWDYWGRGVELAISKLRDSGLTREVVGQLDQLRYQDPAGLVSRVIGNRRWDKDWINSANDNLEIILTRFRERKLPIDQEMANAREILKQYLPEQQKSIDAESSPEELAVSEKTDQPEQLGSLPIDELQALLEAAESMTAEEMLRMLEEELKEDISMQEELSEIAEQIIKEAIAELERAAIEEYNSQRSLEQNDEAVNEEKRLSVRQLQTLADEINQVDVRLVRPARSAAAQGAAEESSNQFLKAEDLLREASELARGANESMLMQELSERSAAVSELLAAAGDAAKAAEQEAAKKTAEDLENKANRNRTRAQMRRLQKTSVDQLARDAQQRAKQWEQVAKNYGGQIANAERQLQKAQQQLKQAQKAESKQPGESSRNPDAVKASQAIDQAESQVRALEAVREKASQLAKQAEQVTEAIKSSGVEVLDANNPAAELAELFGRQGASLVEQMRKMAAEIEDRFEETPGIRAEQNQLAATTQQQAEIQRQVNQVADSLERAARHEQRLGSESSGGDLRQAAEGLRQLATDSIEAARQAAETERRRLADSEQRASSPADGRKVASAVAETRQAIGEQLDKLAGIASARGEQANPLSQGTISQGTEEPDSQQPVGSQLMSANKARSLDDLDRALNSGQQVGASQPELAGAEPKSPSSQSSMSQSAILAQLAAEQASSEARSQPATAGETVLSAASTAENSAGLTPGGTLDGPPTEAASATTFETPLADSLADWGELRERRSEDSSEGRRRTAPRKYRRQIEAYFRSISEKANQ